MSIVKCDFCDEEMIVVDSSDEELLYKLAKQYDLFGSDGLLQAIKKEWDRLGIYYEE